MEEKSDKKTTKEDLEEEEFHECEDPASPDRVDPIDPVNNPEAAFDPAPVEAELDGEKEDDVEGQAIFLDDFVDEVHMKEVEATLTEEQLKERFEQSKGLKERGNEEFKEESWEKSIKSYTKALLICPLNEKDLRAILYSNRAAAKIKHGVKDSALLDCTKSLEYKDNYMKSLIRRAMLYEELDKLDEALEDYKKIFELDHSNKYAFTATQRLPGQINERNEKLKTEMMGKLKDFGNLVLRPFGLSTDSFNLQPTETGGYTLNFKK